MSLIRSHRLALSLLVQPNRSAVFPNQANAAFSGLHGPSGDLKLERLIALTGKLVRARDRVLSFPKAAHRNREFALPSPANEDVTPAREYTKGTRALAEASASRATNLMSPLVLPARTELAKPPPIERPPTARRAWPAEQHPTVVTQSGRLALSVARTSVAKSAIFSTIGGVAAATPRSVVERFGVRSLQLKGGGIKATVATEHGKPPSFVAQTVDQRRGTLGRSALSMATAATSSAVSPGHRSAVATLGRSGVTIEANVLSSLPNVSKLAAFTNHAPIASAALRPYVGSSFRSRETDRSMTLREGLQRRIVPPAGAHTRIPVSPADLAVQTGMSNLSAGGRSTAMDQGSRAQNGLAVTVNLTGDVSIDGRRLGQIMASSQAKEASLPARGPSRVNLRAVPIYTGTQVPR